MTNGREFRYNGNGKTGETAMLRKGIVERQIETLALTLAKFLRLKKDGNAEEARAYLRTACKDLTGLDWNLALTLTPDSLISLLTSEEQLDSGRCATLAILLQEQGLLDEEMGLSPVAQGRYRKAARLLTEAMQHDAKLRIPEFQSRLGDLARRLKMSPTLEGKT